MTSAEVFQTSFPSTNNSPFQINPNPENQTTQLNVNPGFKPYTEKSNKHVHCLVPCCHHRRESIHLGKQHMFCKVPHLSGNLNSKRRVKCPKLKHLRLTGQGYFVLVLIIMMLIDKRSILQLPYCYLFSHELILQFL